MKHYVKTIDSLIKTYLPYFVFGILLLCILNSITLFRIQSTLVETKKEVEVLDSKINQMTAERNRGERLTRPATYRLDDVIRKIDEAESNIRNFIYYH